jgi:hypothetical protein
MDYIKVLHDGNNNNKDDDHNSPAFSSKQARFK